MSDERTPAIWVLSSNRWNSAITEYALSMARAAQIAGFRVTFTPLAGSPAEVRARRCDLVVRPLPHFGLSAIPAAARLAADVGATTVVVCGGQESILARMPSVTRGTRVVRFRGQAMEPRVFGRMRHEMAHAHVSMIIVPGAKLAADVRKVDTTRRVEVVPLGVDATRFARRPRGAYQERPEIVILGRLDPVKGHAAAMDLLNAVLTTSEGARLRPCLHIVGEPANLSVADLERSVAERGLILGEDVKITAQRVEDVAALLSNAAVGLVPSLGSELICRVAEEFLLCGTPVVVSGVGALDEVLAFDGAGGSYLGMNVGEAAGLLVRWIAASIGETEDEAMKRAKDARDLFSLEAMAARLKQVLLG